MAKRSLETLADLIEDRVDKDRADVTFDTFVQAMLNMTLQEIISEVPWARWLLEEHSISLTADQQFVTMPADLDIDAIVSMRDDTNNRKVIRINPHDADRVDPGRDLSGEVVLWWFQRVGGADRLYFLPTPEATDSLTLFAGELITDPTSAQTTALPAKYEWIWMEGAMAKLSPRVEIDIAIHRALFEKGLKLIKRDANMLPDGSEILVGHRPRIGVGITGPRFPTNFDILP